MGFSLGLSMGLRQEFRQILTLQLLKDMPDYEKHWQRKPKHSWTIPGKLIEEDFKELTPNLTQASRQQYTLLAHSLGYGTFFVDTDGHTSEHPAIVTEIINIMPFRITKDGLHYEMALTPSYELVRAPRDGFSVNQPNEVIASRMDLEGKMLEGTHGIVLAPMAFQPPASTDKYICPFIFTDFEPEDRYTRQAFRRVTSARMIGRIFGGSCLENTMQHAVAELLDVEDEYQEWTDDLQEKRIYTSLEEVKKDFPGTDLTKYL